MVQNCGCIDMAELNKTLHIRKGSTEQSIKLYTTSAEAGNAYSYFKEDGMQIYIPLGAENDSRATIGRVKEHTGSQFAILTSGKPPYHKDSYTNAGTYTWTCPAGVTKARVTVAGGGGGGFASKWKFGVTSPRYLGATGGRGANNTSILDVVPYRTYTVVVGAGGSPYVNSDYTSAGRSSDQHAGDGGVSSFNAFTAQGGQGGYFIRSDKSTHNGASYGSGGAGGSTWDTGATAGGTGWVYVEYGGDI